MVLVVRDACGAPAMTAPMCVQTQQIADFLKHYGFLIVLHLLFFWFNDLVQILFPILGVGCDEADPACMHKSGVFACSVSFMLWGAPHRLALLRHVTRQVSVRGEARSVGMRVLMRAAAERAREEAAMRERRAL